MTAGGLALLLLSDTRFHREALTGALGARGIRVTSQWDDFNEVTKAAGSTPLVLVDIASETRSSTVRSVTHSLPSARVVVLAVGEVEGEVLALVDAGATACIPRQGTVDDIVEALRTVAEGRRWYSARATAILLRRGRKVPRALADPPLTRRETQILGLVEKGLSNKQIAKRLSIRVPTVKNHVHRILQKMSVESRNEAAAKARSTRESTTRK